jgi:hypothetical protein
MRSTASASRSTPCLELPGAPQGCWWPTCRGAAAPDADGLTWSCGARAGGRARGRGGVRRAERPRRAAQRLGAARHRAAGAGRDVVGAREVRGVRSEGMLASPRELGLFDHAGRVAGARRRRAPGQRTGRRLGPRARCSSSRSPPTAPTPPRCSASRATWPPSCGCALRDPAEAERGDLGDPRRRRPAVEVEDPERCPRFTLRRIDGVRVGPSPVWLQRRLAASACGRATTSST